MIEGKKRNRIPEDQVEFNTNKIPWSKNRPHSPNTEMQKARYTIIKLRPLIERRIKLHIKRKITLLKTVLMPILTYLSLAWGHINKTNRKKI